MEETGAVAEQRLRDQFPDLPSLDSLSQSNQIQIAEPGAPVPDVERLQESVYQYARKHDGELNLRSCADTLGASPQEVRNALEKLRDAGRIVFE